MTYYYYPILLVRKLGEMFGRQDNPLTLDEEGTWMKSNGSYSTFSWDHDKHQAKIIHGESRIPELMINASNKSFVSYLAKIKRVYDDTLNYVFCSQLNERDKLSNLLIQAGREFEPGDSVNCNGGAGQV